MAVCDFNCFECIYSDCIYDSFNDESGLFYDVSVSREIDSYLLFPDHKRKKYYQEQEHKEYINARQREYYRNCFVYGLGRKLRVLNKNSSTDVDSSQICPHVSNIKNKKSYKERMEEINARQKNIIKIIRKRLVLVIENIIKSIGKKYVLIKGNITVIVLYMA